jgi:hypothetical protein
LKGLLPLRVEGTGDAKIFTVRVKGGEQPSEAKFRAYTNERGLLKVESLSDLPRNPKGR